MADPQGATTPATKPVATGIDSAKRKAALAITKKTVVTKDPQLLNVKSATYQISNKDIGMQEFTVYFNTDKPIDLPKYMADYLGDQMALIPVYLKEDGSVGDPAKPADDVRLAFKYAKAFEIK